MKRAVFSALATLLLVGTLASFAAEPRFEKVSDHFYCFHPIDEGSNVGAVITNGGVLLINPPPEPDLSAILEALRRVTAKPINWVVYTDYSYGRSGSHAYFLKQGALIPSSKELHQLALSAPRDGNNRNEEHAEARVASAGETRTEAVPPFVFSRQMRVYPDGVEVRIFAVQHKARTAGDVVVFLPVEKVLMVGDLYAAASFPEIDRSGGDGSALGWLEGLKQVIDAVPVLKSAMPQPKPDPTKPPPEEKMLEELIPVIPGRGALSNLMEMKLLLEASQKLRVDIGRAISAGRSRATFLASPALGYYRSYKNFDNFAGLLFDELVSQRSK